MKRGVIDTLRRGLDNTLVNWPLLVLRLAEGIVFAAVTIAAVIIAVVPLFVSLGVALADLQTPEGVEELLESLLTRWTLIFYAIGGVLLLLLVFIVIHSFLEAGSARVYVDAEKIAGPQVNGPRSRYRVFSMQRWLAGAMDGWWPVFWIYNLAWGVAGLILLIPLLPTAAGIILLQEAPAAIITIGCLGLAVTLFLMILVAVVVSIWTNRAIADWAVRRGTARETLSIAWRAVKADFGRHLLLAIAIFLISMAGSSFLASFSFFAGMTEILGRDNSAAMILSIPFRMLGTILSMAFSSVMSGWFLASYSALAVEADPAPTMRA